MHHDSGLQTAGGGQLISAGSGRWYRIFRTEPIQLILMISEDLGSSDKKNEV